MKTCRYCYETKPLADFPKTGAKCKACRHEYYLANREHVLAKRKEYYYANREACLAAMKRYRRDNREKIREISLRWQRANRDQVREANRKWQTATRERFRWMVNDYEWRDRAGHGGGNVVRFDFDQFEARMAYFGGQCWLCGSPDASEVDHVKPLSKGGSHMLSNIRPACGPCNRRKASKWPLDLVAA